MCSKRTYIHTAFTGIHTHQTFPCMALSALQQGQLHKENIFGDLRLHQSGETSQCHNTSHDRTSAMLNGREREGWRKKRGERCGLMTVDSSAFASCSFALWPACVSLKLLSRSCIDIDDLWAPGAWTVFCFPGDAHPGPDEAGNAQLCHS